jgi:hypothetical protein
MPQYEVVINETVLHHFIVQAKNEDIAGDNCYTFIIDGGKAPSTTRDEVLIESVKKIEKK